MRVALDTNILAYAEGINDAVRRDAALALVTHIPQLTVFLPVQVLGELFVVLTRKGGRSAGEARETVLGWRDAFALIGTSQAVLVSAMDLAHSHRCSMWDAIILAAAAVAGGIAALLNATRLGLEARAVIMNEPLARGLGINSGHVRFVTFCIGAGLASLAGALITPLSSVDPNMGVPWLVNAFMLVLVSSVSLTSLATAALTLGGAQVLVSTFISPVIGGLTIVVLAALLLRIRPAGFGHG